MTDGAASRPNDAAPHGNRPGRTISFVLGQPTPTLNTLTKWERSHWSKLRNYKRSVAAEIAAQIGRQRPSMPFARAVVEIVRYAAGNEPDPDNLTGGLKGLLDCLVPTGEPRRIGNKVLHPFGLGLISDDNPNVMQLSVRHVRVTRASLGRPRTVVTITELP